MKVYDKVKISHSDEIVECEVVQIMSKNRVKVKFDNDVTKIISRDQIFNEDDFKNANNESIFMSLEESKSLNEAYENEDAEEISNHLISNHLPLIVTEKADKEYIDKETNELKPRFSLIPQYALEEVAKVFTYGAEKYEEHNYSKGAPNLDYIDAALRHINKYLRNRDIDHETAYSHLAHAISNLMMTLDNDMIGVSIDKRNKAYE